MPECVFGFSSGAPLPRATSRATRARLDAAITNVAESSRLDRVRQVTGSSRAAGFLRTANAPTIAVVAGAAYYVGSLIGLELRLPPATPSVLWPPNSVLTALLLFVPPARWWTVLAGAAGAHFAVQLQVWSFAFVGAIFLTNCSEALLAAGAIRYLSDNPSRFDTLRRVSVFLVMGALLAPLASSFLDAGVVKAFNGEDYWAVWKMRFRSNVLAQLAIVPAIAGVLNSSYDVWKWPARRWLEASAIGAGLVLVTFATAFDIGRIGLSNAPLAPFLPLLLWTAVRFGSAGVGLSVLATVFLAVARALYDGGVFQAAYAEGEIRTLQVFLISATVPVLCVGALVEERRKAINTLHAIETLKSTILNSIPSLVAVIGHDGRLLAVNESWRDAREKGVMSEISGEPGTSLLDVFGAAADRGSPSARAAYDGIRTVVDGSESRFALEYCCDTRGAGPWWMMSVVPLKGGQGGAVITHTDITARKRAELEAQRSRDELAHAARAWTMGELTASLSHQLNQPLTAIMGNAHAGRRLLAAAPADAGEVHHILTDIIADTQRASDVIRAVRDMLSKDVSEYEPVDLNDVVRDTTMLVSGEAAMRNASLRLELAPSLPLIVAGRVQLRQVVLNLMMNAIEAMTEPPASRERIAIVRTELTDAGGVHVSVVDTGCGFPDGALVERIFEPLFTTKESGMGMGLPIARAIVEAHGGTMWAANAPAGGGAVHFILPLSRAEPS